MFLTSWLRSISQRLRTRKRRKAKQLEPQRSRRSRAALVETLEARTLLSVDISSFSVVAGTATFTGTAADDALVLSVSGALLAHNLSGGGGIGGSGL